LAHLLLNEIINVIDQSRELQWKNEKRNMIHTFGVRYPTNNGAVIPVSAAEVFVIPNKTPAYLD
jgi:hypothetical protein